MSDYGVKRRIVAKAASYTVVAPNDRPGTVFTNLGATGTVTFTLPVASFATLGVSYRFLGLADQTVTVQPPVSDTAISLNDTAIDSLSFSTGGQKIGACIEATCVQMSSTSFQWLIVGIHVGVTYTIAT